MQRLAQAMRRHPARRGQVQMYLVHQLPETPPPTHAVAPGVLAWGWQDFVRQL